MTASPFTRTVLLIFSGPLVWAAHFLAVYVLAALACARRFAHVEWLGRGVTQWGISLLTLAAVAAILGLILFQHRRRLDSSRFVQQMTLALGLLSVMAIVWEALPAFVVPACV